MQVEGPEQIRNVTLAGHGDTGKTTLASAILFTGGAVNRLNRVEDGNTVTDFDQEEIARGNSIGLATCHAPWRKHKINLVDTPGLGIFATEAQAGMRATDAVLLVVNGVAGVEVNTESIWSYAEKFNQPVMVCLSKMDRERADLDRALQALHDNFGRTVIPIQLPIGKEHDFHGVVDLVASKAYRFKKDGDGNAEVIPIPSELADEVETRRSALIEAVAESSEELMEKFFAEGTLSEAELKQGLRNACRKRDVIPLVVSAAAHGIGTACLLDAMVDYLPSPLERGPFPAANVGGDASEIQPATQAPVTALVFKTVNDPFSGRISFLRVISGTLESDSTVWNSRGEEGEKIGHLLHMQGKQGGAVDRLITGDIGGVAKLKHSHSGDTLCTREHPVKLDWIEIRPPAMSFAIEPKAKGDEEKISDALNRLMEEDLSLHAGRDPQTGELLLSGTGQLHVEITVAKLKGRYKVEVILHPPKVPYRETIRKPAEGHGRHKKQTGGRGQFADCRIKIEPLESGGDFEFVDEIFGGAIPHNFRPAVEKGIQEARQRGYLSGHPVVDFRVRLLDGQYHEVDSSELAFKIAGSLAFKEAMAKAGPTILEPMMSVEITTTEEFMGDIMGELSQRRGRPQGMDTKNDRQIIRATAPMAEMLDFAPALRSITQGRSNFVMVFSHYEETPRNVQEKIIAAARKSAEEE